LVLEVPGEPGVDRTQDNSRPAHGCGTHAPIYPSYRALAVRDIPGATVG
jgi:hypothetical protein